MFSSIPIAAVPASLLALAPLSLPNFRKERYIGDTLCISLGQLASRDQDLIRRFYRILNELLYGIADTATDDAQKWAFVVRWTQEHDLDQFIDEVRELGLASHAGGSSEALSKAMHDVRGGALSALLGRLQLLGYLPQEEGQLKAIFVQTRDHLKIMRNAIKGLDEPRREADKTPKSHAMRLMIDKWHDSVVGPKWRERPILMDIQCEYDGMLTQCCLESAAIDRIFYNLASNACRYTADERLEMAVFPLPEPVGETLRFVLSNRVRAADAATIRSILPSGGVDSSDRGTGLSLLGLFEPKVSSTGSGFGMTVVADFVAEAFGLKDRAHALRERYVGAVLDGETFRVWFHWPMSHDDLPLKLDDYHRPAQSLSDA